MIGRVEVVYVGFEVFFRLHIWRGCVSRGDMILRY